MTPISFTELQQLFQSSGEKPPAPGRIREILERNKIPYFNFPRPWTTQNALDDALKIGKSKAKQKPKNTTISVG